MLMKRLMEVASEDGYKGLSLSVDAENGQALKLYEKLGFEVLDSSSSSWTMRLYVNLTLRHGDGSRVWG